MAVEVLLNEFVEKLHIMTSGVGVGIDKIVGGQKMENKNKIQELIDQCEILLGKKSSTDVAEYLDKNNVVSFPVGIGDTVYYISCSTDFGSVKTNGRVFARKVDALQYDGRIKIISYRNAENDRLGNCYEYLGDMVFLTEEEAGDRLIEIQGG